MSNIVTTYQPNRREVQTSPASTNWTQVTTPADVPTGTAGVSVAITCTNAAGTGAGSVFLVGYDSSSAPSAGFPIQSGQTFIATFNKNIWIKLTTSTDKVDCLYLW